MTDLPTTPALAWGAATDTGRVRTENEDAFIAEPLVYGVADGMGGHAAGEVASAIAAGTLRDRLGGGAQSVDVVVAAVVEANAAIFQGAHNNSAQRGMGTTLTAMVVLADEGSRRLALANVGDSRTYVMRSGRLRRVTIDHSYVQELVSTGHITEAEARSHPRRNIVTRALGIEPNVRVDTWVLPFVLGDRYVLCSDGLVDEVDDDEIAEVLAANPTPQAAADALVAAANEHGGRDNVTVVVVDVLEGDEPPHESVDLDIDVAWDDEGEAHHERLIDAEAGTADGAAAQAGAAAAATAVLPVVQGDARSRRFGLGSLLFLLAIAAIATLTVTLVLVVRHNANKEPTTTTTTTSSTTSTTSTTVDSTSSIAPSSTIVAVSTTAGLPASSVPTTSGG
ncbi:MAG: Stp1/IreP family PP2C-type Ser/Thr phosphatase [Ilumatobacteraceae bacterium]